jgi:hypothetical protein
MIDGAALHASLPVHPHSCPPRRRPCPPLAAASPGTGFGKKPAPGLADNEVTSSGDGHAAPAAGGAKKSSKRATASKVDRLLEAARVPDARPVDAKEAARGRVDFAQAVTWDERAIAALPRSDSAPAQKAVGKAQTRSVTAGTVLDNIQIASFTPGDGGAAGGDPSGAGAAGGSVGPFYEQVVRRMQYLDARGELSISSDRRVAPLPPPQTWDPALGDVAQYLTDVAAVTAAAHAAAQRMQETGGADAQLSAWLLSPHAAERLTAVQQDAATVARLLALTSPAAHTLRVSAMAGAYVQVLTGLGTRGSMAGLCAHGFVQRVTSLTFGHTLVRPLVFRVAAQAAHAAGQPLELVAFDGAPPGKQLAGLRGDMEVIGAALQAQPDALAAFWQELADAVRRTGLLLAPLAKTKA